MSTKGEGSTAKLVQLCFWYFIFYVITGVTLKYYTGTSLPDLPGMPQSAFLVYSTVGGTAVCLGVVFAFRWYRMQSNRLVRIAGRDVPSELAYIIPSGVCTAVVIPTTTLMYTFFTVMVAMVIMRGAVIVISRVIDAIQIRQGILTKRVYWEENVAVVFALLAVAVHFVWGAQKGGDTFGKVGVPALITLVCYLSAYFIRIYIMNYYKNTRPKGAKSDNKGFFAFEQIAASITIAGVLVFVYLSPDLMGWTAHQILEVRGAIDAPHGSWLGASVSGMAFGGAAFFSVFIFMFKGRTATFAGLVNRLTSLIAGTVATLIFHYGFGGKFPKMEDWISLGLIFVAVYFLTRAERRRAHELDDAPVPRVEPSVAVGVPTPEKA